MIRQWTAGDNLTLRRTCVKEEDSSVIDLSSCTVFLYYRIDGGNIQAKTMTILSPSAGRVSYTFLSEDLAPGHFVGEIVIRDGSSRYFTCGPKIERDVVDCMRIAA